ncbi:MAG: AraC family transcriptional regulator [Bacteroidota bacterium]|nr:AraC family transcriptional regulator [Bacteroidota bacterium]
MPEKVYADIIPVLKNLCLTLQPLAVNRHITLNFTTTEEKIQFLLPLNDLATGFSKLISAIIDFVPDNNTISLTATVIEKNAAKYASIKIHNTGINLKMISALIKNSHLPVTLCCSSAYETTFEVCYSLSSSVITDMFKHESVNSPFWNYLNIINGIKSHFAKLNNPVARLAETKPKEAAFLININNCILKNLRNEQFDANALSTAMAMSRAQLLRRLKSLTGHSPGYYIKLMRLEKAKELLETSDICISEAAFQTGFNSPSNFTKVFSEKYGLTPSQFRRPKRNATNELGIATNAIT